MIPDSLLKSRVNVLAEIARCYAELVDPLNGGSGVPGDGSSPIQMPRTYTPTVKEFERLLRLMRHTSDQQGKYEGYRLKTLAFHLEGWHTTAERIIRRQPVIVVSHGKPRQLKNHDGSTKTRPVIAYRRHPEALEERAQLALRWIAEQWSLGHEPMLPRELTEDYQVAA